MKLRVKGNKKLIPLAAAVSLVNFSHTNLAYGEQIEEVMVTAQKRSESVQDIPIAITAFNGESLREDDISGLESIGDRTPGLVFAAFSVGQPEIAIRGIGTKEDGAAASDSTVVSVDDVYIAARTAQVFDIFDLERVEVLRGPQGTLYGKNAIGGSINFVTSKPTDDFTARARTTIGNNGRFDAGGMISGPLTDTLKGKISFSHRSYDGHTKNLLTGETRGKDETYAWRTQLLWEPSDDFSATFSVDGAHDNMGDQTREPVGATGVSGNNNTDNPVLVNQALGGAGDPWNSLNVERGYTDRSVFGVSAKLVWNLNSFDVTAITSYRESDFDWLVPSTAVPGGPAGDADLTKGYRRTVSDSAIEETQQITQEFRLASTESDGLEWLVGTFFSWESIDRTETYCIHTCGAAGSSGVVARPETNHRLIVESSIQSNDSFSWATYGQATYNLTESLGITAGIRYSYEEKDVNNASDIHQGSLILPRGIFISENFDVDAKEDWSNISGKVALNWNVTDDALLYASISTGFKSGGFIGSPSTARFAAEPFDEETATNYEVGLKSYWFERQLQLNVTAFFTDYDDLQVTRFYAPSASATTIGEFITENAASAEIKGIEIEFVALPFEGVEIGGNFAYLDAEFTDFQTDNPNQGTALDGTGPCGPSQTNLGVDSGTGKTQCLPDFSGNQLRQAPKYTASLYAKYTHQFGDNAGRISGKLNYRYQDHSFYDPDNNDIAVIPQYRIWDARLAWTSADERLEIAGWVKNINEEQYRTHIFSITNSSAAFALFAPPRTYGLTATYQF